MRVNKQITAWLLAAAMLLAVFPVQAGAAEPARVTAGGNISYPGSMLGIPVRAENFQDLAALDLEFYYDSQYVTFSHYNAGSMLESCFVGWNSATVGVIKASFAWTSGISGSGDLFWLYFTVREDAPEGIVPLVVTVGDAYYVNLTPAEVAGVNGSIGVEPWPQATDTFYLYHELNNYSFREGDTFQMNLYNSWNHAFASADFIIEYDSDSLAVDKVTLAEDMTYEGAVCSVNTSNPGIVYVSYACTYQRNIYQLMDVRFRVLEGGAGRTQITYRVKDAHNEKLIPYLPYSNQIYLDIAPAPVAQKQPKLELVMPESIPEVGKSCTSVLRLEKDSEVAAANFLLTYDPMVWECTEVRVADGLGGQGGMVVLNHKAEEGIIKLSYINEQGNAADLDVLQITWKAKTSPKTHSTIGVSANSVKNIDYEPLTVDCRSYSGCIFTTTIVDPTCTTPGAEIYGCAGCDNHRVVAQKPALDHSYTTTVAKPTCSAGGYTLHDCIRCDYSYKSDPVNALGHQYGAAEFAWAEDYRCSAKRVCQRDKSHVETVQCTVTYKTDTATCTQAGDTEFTAVAQFQDKQYTDKLRIQGQALGHQRVKIPRVEPGCYTSGQTEGEYCQRCGTVFVQSQPLAPLDHSWDGGEIIVEPTDNTDGAILYTCMRCGVTSRETIPSHGHTHEFAITVYHPTCTDGGYTWNECWCGYAYSSDHVPSFGGHAYGEWVQIARPTGQTEGWQVRTCHCGAEEGEMIPILENPFEDVAQSKFFFEPVLWAYYNDITTGKDATHFNPSGDCTRAQVVTFLWRAAGRPAPASSHNPFPDVPGGKYYTDAVLWAVEQGITAGFKDGTFGPNKTCTRAQIVTFLWRYAQQPYPNNMDNPFPDVNVDAYYGYAVLWAVEQGITGGFKDGTFGPDKTCTRDQIVTFLYRYMVE